MCPNCEADFKKLAKGSRCPECNVKLSRRTEKVDNLNRTFYDVVEETKIQQPTELIEIKEIGKKEWKVAYNYMIPTTIVCPACKELLGLQFSMNSKYTMNCPFCKNTINLEFNLGT